MTAPQRPAVEPPSVRQRSARPPGGGRLGRTEFERPMAVTVFVAPSGQSAESSRAEIQAAMSASLMLAGSDGEHLVDGVVGGGVEVSAVERAEYGEAPPSQALVAVGQRVVPSDVYDEHGRLVDEVRVELVSGVGGLRSVKGRVQQPDAGCFR
jgi:hypothetical protein